MKKRFLSVLMATLLLSASVSESFAATTTETKEEYGSRIVAEMKADNEYLQQLKSMYGTEEVSSSTKYYVTEYTQPSSRSVDQTLQSSTSVFDEYPTEYLEQLKADKNARTITPGVDAVVTYSVIQVTLSYEKVQYVSTDMYYVQNSFVWLELPDPGYLTNMKGAVGLCMADQLSIDGTSYQGRLYYDQYSTTAGAQTGLAQSLSIIASATNAIGASFELTHQSGQGVSQYLTAFSGYIGCVAVKSNSTDEYCSVLGCYENITVSLSDDFSISYPAGFSFGVGTVSTPYNVQDTLTI